MSVKHPGYYTSWLHVVANMPDSTMPASSNINIYDWIKAWTLANYGYEWDNTSKKLNAIITIPSTSTISSTGYSIPAITVDSRFRFFDRITFKIAGKVIGGYREYSRYYVNAGFTLPSQSATSGIITSKNASKVLAQITGGGGGGGTGNEKGYGGGGGGGGGGGAIRGTFYGMPGTSVAIDTGGGGVAGLTDGASSIADGVDGDDSYVDFTDISNSGYRWTAKGGKLGGWGGDPRDDWTGPGRSGPGGAGGTTTTQGYTPSTWNGSTGGNGSTGSSDTSNGTGGAGGDSGSRGQGFNQGGAGPDEGKGGPGGPVGGDGGFGFHAGGGGGGGGFNDRSGGGNANSGGPGADGEINLTFFQDFLTGKGIDIQPTFLGYVGIHNLGGIVAGYAAINGTVDEYINGIVSQVNTTLPVSPYTPT